MNRNGKSIELPKIQLPTENGQLLDLPDFLEEHADFEEEETAPENPEVSWQNNSKFDLRLLQNQTKLTFK